MRGPDRLAAACALGFSGQVEQGFAAEAASEHAVIDLGIGFSDLRLVERLAPDSEGAKRKGRLLPSRP